MLRPPTPQTQPNQHTNHTTKSHNNNNNNHTDPPSSDFAFFFTMASKAKATKGGARTPRAAAPAAAVAAATAATPVAAAARPAPAADVHEVLRLDQSSDEEEDESQGHAAWLQDQPPAIGHYVALAQAVTDLHDATATLHARSFKFDYQFRNAQEVATKLRQLARFATRSSGKITGCTAAQVADARARVKTMVAHVGSGLTVGGCTFASWQEDNGGGSGAGGGSPSKRRRG